MKSAKSTNALLAESYETTHTYGIDTDTWTELTNEQIQRAVEHPEKVPPSWSVVQRRIWHHPIHGSDDGPMLMSMKPGQSGYTVPWAMEVCTDGSMWLRATYDFKRKPGGTVCLPVFRTDAGFGVDLTKFRFSVKNGTWDGSELCEQSPPTDKTGGGLPMIPVASAIGIPPIERPEDV